VSEKDALVAGTFDTKSEELNYLVGVLKASGLPIKTVDLSTSGNPSSADIKPQDVASCHPDGIDAVFTGDRGTAVAALAAAFENWTAERKDEIAGMISANGCLRQCRALCRAFRYANDVLSD